MAYDHVDRFYLSADTYIADDGWPYDSDHNYGASQTLKAAGNLMGMGKKILIRSDALCVLIDDPRADIQKITFNFWYKTLDGVTNYLDMRYSLVDWYEGTKSGETPGAGEDASTWNHRNHNGLVDWTGGVGGGEDDDYHEDGPFGSWPDSDIKVTPEEGWKSLEFDWFPSVSTLYQKGFWIFPNLSSGRSFDIRSRTYAGYEPYFEVSWNEVYAQKVSAKPGNLRNTHHVVLRRSYQDDDGWDRTDEVGLILCDINGNKDFRSVKSSGIPRDALKTASGATEHADFQPPYSTLEQDDFSYGRGYPDQNKQAAGYFEANGMDTSKPDYFYPAGLPMYAEGIRKGVNRWHGYYHPICGSGSIKFDYYNIDNNAVIATPWVAGANETDIEHFEFLFRVVSGNNNNIRSCEPVWFICQGSVELDAAGCYGPDMGNVIYYMRAGIQTGDKYWWRDNGLGDDDDLTGRDYVIRLHPVTGGSYPGSGPTTASFTPGTTYWMVSLLYSGGDTNVGPVLMNRNNAYYASHCISWQFYGYDPYYPWFAPENNYDCDEVICSMVFRGVAADKPFKAHFGEVDRVLHAGLEYLDGSNGEIYFNGDFGLARFKNDVPPSPNTQRELTVQGVATPGTVQDDYENQILRILRGPGSKTFQDWARISDITEDVPGVGNSEVRVEHTFYQPVALSDPYSLFCIQNSLKFTKITDSGITSTITHPFTSMRCVNNALLFCFGDDTTQKVRRLRYLYDFSIATPDITKEWVEENFYADDVGRVTRATADYVYSILKETSKINYADVPDWYDPTESSILSWDSNLEMLVGQAGYPITGWAVYGDDPHLWIMKENLPYEIINDEKYEFRQGQMGSMIDSRNGRAATAYDSFLFFGFHEGLERWHYNGDLKSVGINKLGPSGMAPTRKGYYADVKGYADLLLGAYDAGPFGWSSIIAYNGVGWTELFRAPFAGQRITSLYIQSIDGEPVDWLWFSCGSDIMRIPLSPNPLGHTYDDWYHYPFRPYAEIESSWVSVKMKDVSKYASKFGIVNKLFVGEYGQPTGTQTYEEYGVDFYARKVENVDYTLYSSNVNDSPVANIWIEESFELLQWKMVMYNHDSRFPMLIDAVMLDNVVRLPSKEEVTIQFRLMDNELDLNDNPDPITNYNDKADLIREFANLPEPVDFELDAKYFADRKMFVQPGSLTHVSTIRDGAMEVWIMQLTLIDD